MSRLKAWSLLILFGSLVLLSVAGCNAKYKLPPLPVVPPTFTPTYSPTPTFTPGCQASGFTTLNGSATYGTAAVSFWSSTPTPAATPTWTWTGTLPPHPGGVFVLQSASDWNQFVAGSYLPGGSYTIPFDPARQALVVVGTEGYCPDFYSFGPICNDGAQVTVQLDQYQSCCPAVFVLPWVYNTTSYSAVIVDRGSLPVVLHQTYHPMGPMICL